MSRDMLTFNLHEGNLEAIVHGYKDGLLRMDEYNNLTQCDTLADLKSQLQATEYGNFLQSEGVITTRVITEKATEKLVNEFDELRGWCDKDLGKFLDFIAYDYMISNVLKLISAVRNGRDSLDILYKSHPLGLFPGIAALTAATSVEEMFDVVLVDSPIGQFFSNASQRDFDELSLEYIRGVLQKNYLEAFYDFVMSLGGETATVMGRVLEFEADRLVVTVAANTCGIADLLAEDRKKLFPDFGSLVAIHDELSTVDSVQQLADRLKHGGFAEYGELFGDGQERGGADGKGKSVERKLSEWAVEVYKDSMTRQFQYGVFYGWVKLRELEVQNLLWISECVTQQIKTEVHNYINIV